jgi:hypothetical protein
LALLGQSFSRRFDESFIRKNDGVLQIEGIWEAEDTVKPALTCRVLKKGEQSHIIRRLASPKALRQVSPGLAMTKVSRSSPG